MQRFVHWVLVLAFLLLSACGGDEEPTPTPPPAPPPTTAPTPTVAAAAPATDTPQPVAPADTSKIVDPIRLPTPDPAQVAGVIHIEGSASVYHISIYMTQLFARVGYHANVQLKSTDTGPGFKAFCQKDGIDIVNASRPIKPEEIKACQDVGREPIEFQVARGAVGIIVHPDNTFLTKATLEQVAHIFSNEATNWSDIDPSWPKEPIARFSLEEGSGTFDYFVKNVMNPVYAPEGSADPAKGKATLLAAPNLKQVPRSSDLMKEVSKNPNAIGYVGMLDYHDSSERLQVLALNGFPALPEYYHEGQYPLTRPLFIYSDAKLMREKPQVAAFIDFYLSEVNREIGNVGLNPLEESILNVGRQRWLDIMQQ